MSSFLKKSSFIFLFSLAIIFNGFSQPPCGTPPCGPGNGNGNGCNGPNPPANCPPPVPITGLEVLLGVGLLFGIRKTLNDGKDK